MAHNSLTGTVIAPSYFGPGSGPGTNIISGTLRGDGSDILYVPRVSNATNDSILTNVGGDANNLTCETNLKFDGDTLTVQGGVVYKRAIKTGDYTIADTDFYIGVNSAGGAIKITLPAATSFSSGQTWIIKDEGGNASSNNITVSASFGTNTIDGQNSIVLVSPYASVQVYCDGSIKYYIC